MFNACPSVALAKAGPNLPLTPIIYVQVAVMYNGQCALSKLNILYSAFRYKSKILMLSIFICLISSLAFAKTLDSIPEPEFVNEVYYYDKANLKLLPLEKANAEMKAKMKLIGGASPAYTIGGDKSFIRINQQGSSFMITVSGGPMMDPSMTISLYRFESKKGRREAAMSLYGGQRNGGNAVEIKFKKVREGTYEIVIPENLEKGEYGFVNAFTMNAAGGLKTFAFGVD